MKERKARGTHAVLMTSHQFLKGVEPFIRVYWAGGKFTDYAINNYDIAIEITDDDAVFRDEDTDNPYIDYSNQTLGKK